MTTVTQLFDDAMTAGQQAINADTVHEMALHNINLADELRYFIYCAEVGAKVSAERIETAKGLIR